MRKIAVLPSCLALLLSGSLMSCNEPPKPTIDPNLEANKHPVVADLEHRVGPGETLAVISQWYTGKPTNWAAIKGANPGLNPNKLRLGQVVIIPGDMVIRREPIPRSFMKASSAKSNKKAPASVLKTEDTPTSPFGGASSGGGEIVEKPMDLGSGSAPSDFGGGESQRIPANTIPPNTDPGSKATLDDLLGDAPSSSGSGSSGSAPVAQPTVEQPKSTGSNGAAKDKPAGGSDAEREKLLDELLSQ